MIGHYFFIRVENNIWQICFFFLATEVISSFVAVPEADLGCANNGKQA
jgi:hypothetical protein